MSNIILIVFSTILSIVSGCTTALVTVWLWSRSEKNKVKKAFIDELDLNAEALEKAAENLAKNRPILTTFYTNAYRELISRGIFTEIPLNIRREVEDLYQILIYLNDMRKAHALKIYDIREYVKTAHVSQLVQVINHIRFSLRSLWKIKQSVK